MKVIFFLFQFDEIKSDGGLESTTQIIQQLEQVNPIIVTQRETQINERWRQMGAEVRLWPRPYYERGNQHESNRKRMKQIKDIIRMNLMMYNVVIDTGADIVHHSDIWWLWCTALGARAAGADIVFNARNAKSSHQQYGWHWRTGLRLCNQVITLSKDMTNVYKKIFKGGFLKYMPCPNVENVYSIVDFSKYSPESLSEGELKKDSLLAKSHGKVSIGCVGKVENRKGQLELLKSVSNEIMERKNLNLFFVGDFDVDNNSYALECQKFVRQKGLSDSIHFVGYVENIDAWYESFNVVVIPSQREGLARCMIESISCGTPVVSFDVASAREVLEEYNCGYVVDIGEYKRLYERAVNLASDKMERKKLSRNGVAASRKLFDGSRVGREYERIYENIVYT